MRPPLSWVLAGALVTTLAYPGQAVFDIEHTALTCVPVGRYARVTARSATRAGRAEVQFRSETDGGWYAVRMAEQDGEWTAFLPRATSTVRLIEYRIVMTGADSTIATSLPTSVPVQDVCDGDAQASVPSPIVIRVPEGAPAVPPVPAGFAPAGVILAEQKRGLSRGLKIAAGAAGAAVLGATAVAVAGATSPREPNPIVPPEFRFNSISPVPGSTLVRNREGLAVSLVMSHQPTFPLAILWRVDFVSSSTGLPCVLMNGIQHVQAPLAVTLSSVVVPAPGGGCGPPPFDTDTVRIGITHANEGQLLHDSTHAFSYRFVP